MPALDLLVKLGFGNPCPGTHPPAANLEQNVTGHEAAAGEGRTCRGSDARCKVPCATEIAVWGACFALPGTAAAPAAGLGGAG